MSNDYKYFLAQNDLYPIKNAISKINELEKKHLITVCGCATHGDLYCWYKIIDTDGCEQQLIDNGFRKVTSSELNEFDNGFIYGMKIAINEIKQKNNKCFLC